MASLVELEQDFWSQVWRCEHSRPCQKCCWPWREALIYAQALALIPGYGRYHVPDGGGVVPAHRMAIFLERYAFLLPFGHKLHLCHRCNFAPCCNTAHLFLGTPAENVRDAANKGWFRKNRALIWLPNGEQLAPALRLYEIVPGLQ